MLGLYVHALRDWCLTGQHVRPAVDLHRAIETNPHATEQTTWFTASACSAQHPAAASQQRGSYGFPFIGQHLLAVECEAHWLTSANGANAPELTPAIRGPCCMALCSRVIWKTRGTTPKVPFVRSSCIMEHAQVPGSNQTKNGI